MSNDEEVDQESLHSSSDEENRDNSINSQEESAESKHGERSESDDDQNSEEEHSSEPEDGRESGSDNERENDIELDDEQQNDKRDMENRPRRTEEEIVAGKLSRQIRDVAVEVKKARAFEVQKIIRKLKQARHLKEKIEAKGETEGLSKKQKKACNTDRLEKQLKLVKRIDYHGIAGELILEKGYSIPKKLAAEWALEKDSEGEHNLKIEGSKATDEVDEPGLTEPEKESEREFLSNVLDRIKQARGVSLALRRVEEKADMLIVKMKKERSAKRKISESERIVERPPKTIPCGIGVCGAKFSSVQDRAAHWKRRHARVFEDRVLSKGIDANDPYAHLELAEMKTKKNRMGQRERQRLAQLKEKEAERELARAEGRTLPPTKKQKTEGGDRERSRDRRPADNSRAGKSMDSRQTRAPVQKQVPKAVETPAEELHPSWEAKKKEKEMASMMNEAAFQGKRVTFDSDSE